MPETGVILAFALLELTFAVTPGPAVVLVAGQALSRGTGAGVMTGLGVQVGNGIYLALSLVGLGAVLATSELAFAVVKYAGAAYLIWLGIRTWRSARAVVAGDAARRVPLWRTPFVQGAVNQLSNPKSILFFGALMPQFVDPAGSLLVQGTVFALVCAVVEMPVLAVYAWLAASGGRHLTGATQVLWRERLSGAALMGVGAFVALLRR